MNYVNVLYKGCLSCSDSLALLDLKKCPKKKILTILSILWSLTAENGGRECWENTENNIVHTGNDVVTTT